MCLNQKGSKVAKHIDIKHHKLDDLILKRRIHIEYLQSGKQLADALTKARSNIEDITHLLGSPPKSLVSGEMSNNDSSLFGTEFDLSGTQSA